MGSTTIEWTDKTNNPIRGTKGRWHCTHVSEGCRNCYAERINKRWGGPAYKPGLDTLQLNERILLEPLTWKKPCRIFLCDMTDMFHEEVKAPWLFQIWDMMRRCPHHTFQILTKRAKRMQVEVACLSYLMGKPLPNVWLGVSVEDQKAADERIPLLLETPAAVRFISYEPALGPVDFAKAGAFWSDINGQIRPEYQQTRPHANWIICGGESGFQARPFDLKWARETIAQCKAAEVPVFMKQIGSRCQIDADDLEKERCRGLGGNTDGSLGRTLTMRLKHPKGGDPLEWPEDLRVRAFPKEAVCR